MLTLHSPYFELILDPDSPCLSLTSLPDGFPRIRRFRLAARCRQAGRAFDPLAEGWQASEVSGPLPVPSSLHGPGQGISLRMPTGASGLAAAVDVQLPGEFPLVLWRVRLENQGSRPVTVDSLTLLDSAPGSLELAQAPGEPRFFSNGWQSWSASGSYGPGQRARRSRLGPVQSPLTENASTPFPRGKGRFASDFFGALTGAGSPGGLTVGFLSQKEAFGSLLADLCGPPALRLTAAADELRLDPGASFTTDWAVIAHLDRSALQPFDPYLDAVAREHGLSGFPPPLTGWCSWYHYYTRVTAADVRRNLAQVQELVGDLPLQMVQLDDGFQSQVGDWFTFRPGFPEGVAPLAAEIRDAGLTPGLWLAPFILHPSARLVQDHPDWVLRGRGGRPVNAGFVWDRFTRALDLSHPAACEHACRVVETAAGRWGYPFLKLDFLYAGALAGRRFDPTRTRAQVLRQALEGLRRAAGPETFLLGCGAPLGSSIGLFEAMRVGPDVSGDWHPTYFNVSRPFRAEPGMPSARNAIASVLQRAPLHRRWWINDPDCLLVRPDTRLTLPELQSLATVIGLAGGSLLLSDDLPALPEERLRIAQALLPPVDQRPAVPDLLAETIPARLRLDLAGPAGPWSLAALINWADEPHEMALNLAGYGFDGAAQGWGVEFWTQKVVHFGPGESIRASIPPHGVSLWALRIADGQDEDVPSYLGGDLHISQGMEISRWECRPEDLRLHLSLPRRAAGSILLRLPAPPNMADLNGQPIGWQEVGQGVYRFKVSFEWDAEMRVCFSGIRSD